MLGKLKLGKSESVWDYGCMVVWFECTISVSICISIYVSNLQLTLERGKISLERTVWSADGQLTLERGKTLLERAVLSINGQLIWEI